MKTTWEYVVQDFLEIGCRLNKEEILVAMKVFQQKKIMAEHLEVHPTFSFNGQMMTVLRQPGVQECWFYFVCNGKLQKFLFHPIP